MIIIRFISLFIAILYSLALLPKVEVEEKNWVTIIIAISWTIFISTFWL